MGAGALKAPAPPPIRLIVLWSSCSSLPWVILTLHLIPIDQEDKQGPHETPHEPMTERQGDNDDLIQGLGLDPIEGRRIWRFLVEHDSLKPVVQPYKKLWKCHGEEHEVNKFHEGLILNEKRPVVC